MSSVIEELYYGNLEPQELTTEITPKLKKKLGQLVKKEEELSAILPQKEKELFSKYVSAYAVEKSYKTNHRHNNLQKEWNRLFT